MTETFDPDCRRCPRLAKFLESLKPPHPGYHNGPVAPFGVQRPRLLIVGLAPGMHGANATGRPFTGDFAGILLYETLFSAGLANQPTSERGDALALTGCRITNAVKCLPPANKPTTAEVDTCNGYLAKEIEALDSGAALLALGGIAHRAVLKAVGLKLAAHPFAHGARFDLPHGRTLISSYHCSRYNTQTKRLTPAMFQAVVAAAKTAAGLT